MGLLRTSFAHNNDNNCLVPIFIPKPLVDYPRHIAADFKLSAYTPSFQPKIFGFLHGKTKLDHILFFQSKVFITSSKNCLLGKSERLPCFMGSLNIMTSIAPLPDLSPIIKLASSYFSFIDNV